MGRPREFDPDAAVEHAMEVFWRKGYAATTPQDLVDALGIGKGSLYNAFGSKQALFERALHRYRESQVVGLIELLEAPGPVRERLRTALRFLTDMDFADPEHRGCMAVNAAAEVAATNARAADLVSRMFERTETAFQALIEEGQRSGEIARDRDASAAASLLLNTVVGLRVLTRIAVGRDRHDRVINAAVAQL
jgi:TetR/AcrR family transcriptional repressor of nem operon